MQGVRNRPTLKCVKDVQKFLGLTNYYCWFIEGFTSIARPLYEMTRKKMKWSWGEKQQRAFEELNVVAITRPMSNSSTTSKSQRQISSRKHELCNLQENSIENHNNILPTIYITIHVL